MSTRAYRVAEQRYANLETTLNCWGYIPIASSFSGALRGLIGSVQTVVANIGLGLKGCQYFCTRNSQHRKQAASYFMYGIHGAMNVTRGGIESIPIVGNLLTLIYDSLIGLRANYTYEVLPSGVDPIFENIKKN